ncbi:hypothetical protein SOVF_115360, partial [Spinacia oleracea]
VPACTANAMVGVINRLKSALVRARSALSCRSPHSTRVMCPLFLSVPFVWLSVIHSLFVSLFFSQTAAGRAGADDAGPSGGGHGRRERERARHSPLRHRRSDAGVSSSGERSEPERRRRSVSVAREPSPELQSQPHFWGDSGWGPSYHGEWSGWTGEAWRHGADDES